ncbi:MAG: hypothetical protein Q4A75_09385 [Peptostreptococcaceae bacterium]|nr:hypothetical protein [Peptostreptococcaceae bacterium]
MRTALPSVPKDGVFSVLHKDSDDLRSTDGEANRHRKTVIRK